MRQTILNMTREVFYTGILRAVLIGLLIIPLVSFTQGCASSTVVEPAGTSQPSQQDKSTDATTAEKPRPDASTDIPPPPTGDEEMAPTPPRSTTSIALADDMPALPVINREFRGVWLTTVKNSDWPSSQDLTTAEQQQELVELMDRAKEIGLNAIIFQVRPTADAVYASSLEPWSVYLTGKQGRAPDPFWDPLQFAVRAAHDRGLELHAWFNPFRASFDDSVVDFDKQHVSQSDMVAHYGPYIWMDPGNPDAVAHSINIIVDVLNRYDLDGIHLDDYFYPYPVTDENGDNVPFPDDSSWQASGGEASGISRADWRRQNVDQFVELLATKIRENKPWVKFGISPFGIWKPGYPESVQGLDAFEVLYADSRKWLLNGWIDYMTPQLYWAMDSPGQSYPALLEWWTEQNTHGRHLWPGNFASRITLSGAQYWGRDELYDQLRYTQSVDGANGNVLFRMQALMPAEHLLGDGLRSEVYTTVAVTPESSWMKAEFVPDPVISISDNGTISASVAGVEPESISNWVVRYLDGGEWEELIEPGFAIEIELGTVNNAGHITGPSRKNKTSHVGKAICVSTIDRIGREGVVVCYPHDS
jgi:uncharacterized lipoprotein YddW (UPF0748 family)